MKSINEMVDEVKDMGYRECGAKDAEKMINNLEAWGASPVDLVEYAYGIYEYFCGYLGFTQEAEGSSEAWDDWKQVEEDEEPAIKTYCPAHSGRVELIQLADALVREFGQDFPYDPTEEVMPAPLAYWFREGVPSTLTFDWEWLATYTYDDIACAYGDIRSEWLPDLPELAWDEV